jgi:hypothetical protein
MDAAVRIAGVRHVSDVYDDVVTAHGHPHTRTLMRLHCTSANALEKPTPDSVSSWPPAYDPAAGENVVASRSPTNAGGSRDDDGLARDVDTNRCLATHGVLHLARDRRR